VPSEVSSSQIRYSLHTFSMNTTDRHAPARKPMTFCKLLESSDVSDQYAVLLSCYNYDGVQSFRYRQELLVHLGLLSLLPLQGRQSSTSFQPQRIRPRSHEAFVRAHAHRHCYLVMSDQSRQSSTCSFSVQMHWRAPFIVPVASSYCECSLAETMRFLRMLFVRMLFALRYLKKGWRGNKN
jgi:hypothetical protein